MNVTHMTRIFICYSCYNIVLCCATLRCVTLRCGPLRCVVLCLRNNNFCPTCIFFNMLVNFVIWITSIRILNGVTCLSYILINSLAVIWHLVFDKKYHVWPNCGIWCRKYCHLSRLRFVTWRCEGIVWSSFHWMRTCMYKKIQLCISHM